MTYEPYHGNNIDITFLKYFEITRLLQDYVVLCHGIEVLSPLKKKKKRPYEEHICLNVITGNKS